ncbi:tetratricopeptide repeat protein [Planococcus sp. YIM B11945]|uniref:tetratricopeptide repeat protein n=1 Tax=Planococcus sp. YIM B11945 TaxID=3435410 RepID=UPI003D7CCE42
MRAKEIQTADQLIEAIRILWKQRSISKLHMWLKELETEDDYYRLIRLADQADLNQYSNFLATHAYKRFGTLRPFAWHCTRLLETGKSLEAEERMVSRLYGISDTDFTSEERFSAHQLLFRVFCQLNRLPEAKEQLKKIGEAKGILWPDVEAFYYLHSGEWEKAESIFKNALLQEEANRKDYVLQLYAYFLAMTGRQAESLEMLQKGQAAYPENWSFSMEQVKRLCHLGRYQETIHLIKEINARNPFHIYQDYYIYLTAECLYKLEKWEELLAWIQENQNVLEKTIYGKTTIQRNGNIKELKLTPKVQKLDYCVPASLSIMLEAFGMEIDQDEIASHVFDVTGSKLKTTMAYMESLGLKAQYFKGSVEVYKKIIDAGVPVLLSMMIENNAHVQIIVGYDDRLQALIIQDPNDQSPFLISYADVKENYKMTDSLSMVFVKEEQKKLLGLLNNSEHLFFTKLYEFLDEEGEDESEAFLDFLDQREEELYAAVIGIVALFSEGAKTRHEKWLERLRTEFGTEDSDLSLLTAHMHYQKDELPEALACLANVNEQKSPYALFLRAVILMSQNSHIQAIPLLKQSIELDHYQPLAYSHLARCYLDMDKTHQAYKWSKIAFEQLPTDIYVQITHSLIQYESGAYEKALTRFQKLNLEQPEDGYYIYEVGRCLLALGKENEAIASFEKAIEIDVELPYSYLRIAEIHMEAENWEQAEEVVHKGLERAKNKDVLHLYRGHIGLEKKQYTEAESAYRKALELDPEDMFAVTCIAHALIKQKRFSEAAEFVSQFAEKGDIAYFIRTASMLWAEWPEFAGKELAVSFLEKGLEKHELDGFSDMVRQYAEFGEEPLFLNRVLNKLKELRQKKLDETLFCYEGHLHELSGNQQFARKLYEQSAENSQNPFAYYRLGLLEEEANRHDKAIRNYLRCVELDPGYSSAHEGLMRSYSAIDSNSRAFAAALHILQNDPLELDFNELFNLATTEEAVKAISKTLEHVSDQVPEEWLLVAKAHCAEKEGAIVEAEELFKRAKAVNGAFPSHYQYAEFLVRRGELNRAATLLEDLITEQPEEERLYGEYIRILAETDKKNEISKRLKKRLSGEKLAMAETYCADHLSQWFLEEEAVAEPEKKGVFGKMYLKAQQLRTISTVITLYEEAAKRIPENEMPVIRLAKLYLDREMAKEAADELKPFVKRTGNYEAACLQMQATIQLAEEKNSAKLYRNAIEQAQVLHKQQPMDTSVLMGWGFSLEALGEPGKALEQYEHVIRLEPFNGEAYVRMLQLLAEHRSAGIEAFVASIPEELRKQEWIRLAHAVAYLSMDKAMKAQKILVALTEEEREFLPAYYELARCEMMLNNKQAAISAIQQLLRKEEGELYVASITEDPLFEPIYEELDRLVEELV